MIPENVVFAALPFDVAKVHSDKLSAAHGNFVNMVGADDEAALWLSNALGKEEDGCGAPESGIFREFLVTEEELTVAGPFEKVIYSGFML